MLEVSSRVRPSKCFNPEISETTFKGIPYSNFVKTYKKVKHYFAIKLVIMNVLYMALEAIREQPRLACTQFLTASAAPEFKYLVPYALNINLKSKALFYYTACDNECPLHSI